MSGVYMEYLFYMLAFNSLSILGIWKIFDEGMVFEGIGNKVKVWAGEFWSKPLLSCPPCMASVHGTIVYFTFVSGGLLLWPFYVLALAGLNYIVIKVVER